MVKNTMEHMLADGFARRMAQEYLDQLTYELSSDLFNPEYRAWAHSLGFFAESAYAYGLTEENASKYLSDYDFYKLWPLNDWQRIWINDKLTLGYMLAGTKLEHYLPEYYYYTSADRLVPLYSSDHRTGHEALLECLKAKGMFACKPCNGALSAGFHTLAHVDGSFSIDHEPTDEAGIIEFVEGHRNYVFTEFLHPSAEMAAIDPLIHTMRVIVTNPDGVSPKPIATYLRFAVADSASKTGANYQSPTSADICSYNVYINPGTGEYGRGKLVYANKVVDAPCHPVSGVKAEGTVACWPDVLAMMRDISLQLGPVEYLGFDVGITPDGPRIMEINSHSGCKYIQVFEPIWENPVAAPYFRAKLDAIDALTEEQRTRRNRIVH